MTKVNPSPRIHYIDVLKGLAIYLICLYHFGKIQLVDSMNVINVILLTICSCAVPIFFMCSGAVLLNKDINFKLYIKKIIKLILLTGIWAILTTVILMLFRYKTINIIEVIKIVVEWRINWINHFWFLHAMLVVYLFYSILKIVIDKDIKYIYILLGFIIVTVFGNNFLNICYSLFKYVTTGTLTGITSVNFINFLNIFSDKYLYVLAYFIVGGLLYRKRLYIKYTMSKYIVLIILLLTMIIYIVLNTYMLKITNYNYDIVWNGYQNIFTLILSVGISTLAQTMRIKNCKWIVSIGTNTFGIFILHWIVGFIMQDYFVPTNIVIDLFYVFLIVGSCDVIVCIMKRIPVIKNLFKF